MKYYLLLVLLIIPLLACEMSIGAASPTVPPTPSGGGITTELNSPIPDFRFGESGGSCGAIAADMKNQTVAGTLTIFPNTENNQLRAVTNNGSYRGTAVLLQSNCQPTGTSYNLTATFGADYNATLGTVGGETCIVHSNLILTSFDLQGLPAPLNLAAKGLVASRVPEVVTPKLDELVAQQLNGGNLPASGAQCPGP